jgi:DNA-binding response OmpR family regulator
MEQSPRRSKIVIVEDNTDLSLIYKTRLEMLGYECIEANDGIAALYFIQKELPDLVLLDLMVPGIAGDQILIKMRGSNWGKDIPVFIISNLNEADAPKGLRNLGIEGYAVKANLSNDQLDQIVKTILKPSDPATDTASTTQAAPVEAAPAPQTIEVAPAPPVAGTAPAPPAPEVPPTQQSPEVPFTPQFPSENTPTPL